MLHLVECRCSFISDIQMYGLGTGQSMLQLFLMLLIMTKCLTWPWQKDLGTKVKVNFDWIFEKKGGLKGTLFLSRKELISNNTKLQQPQQKTKTPSFEFKKHIVRNHFDATIPNSFFYNIWWTLFSSGHLNTLAKLVTLFHR